MLFAYNVHILAADSGIASSGSKLYSLVVHGDRQTIFPLAVLVEKVDSGALCAELTLVQHEYTIGILLLLCKGRCSDEQADNKKYCRQNVREVEMSHKLYIIIVM